MEIITGQDMQSLNSPASAPKTDSANTRPEILKIGLGNDRFFVNFLRKHYIHKSVNQFGFRVISNNLMRNQITEHNTILIVLTEIVEQCPD
jgi:hypothetical protein